MKDENASPEALPEGWIINPAWKTATYGIEGFESDPFLALQKEIEKRAFTSCNSESMKTHGPDTLEPTIDNAGSRD